MPVHVRRLLVLAALVGGGTAVPGCLRVPDDFSENPDGTPGAPSSAAEVLERHIEGIGGKDAVAKIQQRTVEARMIFHPETGCEDGEEGCMSEEQSGTFVLQNTADGRLYRRTVMGELMEERGFDGKIGWQLQGNGALRVDTEQEAVGSREDALLHWYFGVAERGVATELLPPRREDSEGKVSTLDGILWKVAGADPKEMWFDRETGMLREERVIEGEGDTQTSQTIIYDDYRDIDGVLVSHTIRVVNRVGDRSQLVEFVTQRTHHDPIESEKYAVPDLPEPEPKDDPWRQQLDTSKSAAAESPRDASAQVEWTRSAFQAAHFDEAARAAKETLALDAKEPEALWVLARVQVLQGDYAAAKRTLSRLAKTGVKPEVVAREEGWILHRHRDYGAFADKLDTAGNPVMAGRYRSFAGKPIDSRIEAKGGTCAIELPMLPDVPLAVVDLTIGEQTVGAIIDTGAADLIITETMAEKLGVTVHARSRLAEGMPDIGHGQLEEVAISDLHIANVPVNIFDDASIADMAGEGLDKVQAVVGMGLLTDYQVTIDVPNRKLRLVRAAAKCRKDLQAQRTNRSIPFWLHETHYIYLLGSLEGAEGLYLLNTGMRGADMTATQLAYAVAGIGTPALRSDQAPMVSVDRFGLEDAFEADKLASAFGYFEQTQTSDGFRLDGMIGLGTVGRVPFTLDFEQHRIYFPDK